MKKPLSSTVASAVSVAAALLSAPASHAVPLYYTFQGNVVYTTTEARPLGMPVDFTFLVDRDVDGQTMDAEGNLTTVADYYEAVDYYTLSFYSAYVGGSALPSDNPEAPIKQSSLLGVELRRYDEIFSAVRGSNSDRGGYDLIDIWSYDLNIGDWYVGQSLLGENFVMNGPGELNTSFSSALTLTSITDYNPLAAVPEPSTLSYLGLGLVGLGAAFWKRRRT